MGRGTLKSLLEKYEVHIPQLQRDYAQGREVTIRRTFIKQLHRTLTAGDHLNLDFIYGYIKDGVYYPLDGQQRLTTLWLLHWYLAPAEACPEAKVWLKKFGYRTRIIAERFCNALVDAIEDLRGENVVESLKKKMPWMRLAWEKEPSVAAMLLMLEEIERQFGNEDRAKLWERLTGDVAQPAITFDSIDMRSEEFRLTDELYIKMNARGKALTPFESYKAHLTEVLRSVQGMREYNGASMNYEAYFSLRADNQWLDLFWNPEQTGNIDTPMLNFYRTLARLCFFRQPQEDGRFIERPVWDFDDTAAYEVFRKEENAHFLFDTLDLFCEIKNGQGIKGFFVQLFQGIRLFDEQNNGNLFDEACKKLSPDVRSQILLLFVVEYMRTYNVHECNDALRDFVHVVRNLLARKRTWEKTHYGSDVRINRTGIYWKEWSPLLVDADVYRALNEPLAKTIDAHECHKAALVLARPECKTPLQRLEEHPLLLGITDALEVTDIDQWAVDLPNWTEAFYDIWGLVESEDDYRIAQALIAYGFDGRFIVGVNSYRGKAMFMGKHDSWSLILTSEECDDEWRKYHIAAPLQMLLRKYCNAQGTPIERLQSIVDDYWKNATIRDWHYYFCKYPEILKNSVAYFAFSLEDKWDVRSLETKLSLRPTRGWHCNPYAYVVGNRLGKKEIIAYLQGGDDNVALELLGSVSIRSVKEGWLLGWWENAPFKKEDFADIYAQFGIGIDEHVLRETPEQDRIEIAIDFCSKLLAKYI